MIKHLYLIHGLRVSSDVKLTGALPYEFEAAADITIERGKQDEDWFWEGQRDDYWINVSEDRSRVRLNVSSTTTFLVSNGRSILFDTEADPEDGAFLAFLVGRVFAAALYQRAHFPLHASAVEIGNSAVLILGERGMGKSTLSAYASVNDHNLLCDDVSNLDIENGLIHRGFARNKLFEDSINWIGRSSENLVPVDGQEGKYFMPTPDLLTPQTAPVSCIFELSKSSDTQINASKKDRLETLEAIKHHSFEFDFVRALNLNQKFLEYATRLTQRIPVFELAFPRNFEALPDVLKTIKQITEDNER